MGMPLGHEQVIGGGLPVGAYGGRKDIMEMVAPAGPMYQAGTLSGNPLAMTAGIKVGKMLVVFSTVVPRSDGRSMHATSPFCEKKMQ